MAAPYPRVRGGQRAQAFILRARAAQAAGVRTVAIGFFETARYSNQHLGIRGGRRRQPVPVAAVAAWNEYGTTNGVPERPFMRTANQTLDPILLPILIAHIDPEEMALDRKTAGLLGEATKGHIQRTITEGDWIENAPSTQTRKSKRGGPSKELTPLVDTGHMRNKVTYRINDPAVEA